jgi:hypothetical protein
MANIHEVAFEGTLPFDWSQQLTPEDAQTMASWFLSPSIGIRLEFHGRAGSVPSKHGGQTALYRFTVTGSEAVWTRGAKALADLFRKYGTVHSAKCRDYEQNGPWVRV